jgi:hypothetical protein
MIRHYGVIEVEGEVINVCVSHEEFLFNRKFFYVRVKYNKKPVSSYNFKNLSKFFSNSVKNLGKLKRYLNVSVVISTTAEIEEIMNCPSFLIKL